MGYHYLCKCIRKHMIYLAKEIFTWSRVIKKWRCTRGVYPPFFEYIIWWWWKRNL